MNGVTDKLVSVAYGDEEFPLVINIHPRAKRVSLRADPVRHCIVLVRPPRVSEHRALTFAQDRADWIRDRYAEMLLPVPFTDGAVVPVLDMPHVIRSAPEARQGVWRESGAIHVSGRPEHLARRVTDWFKNEARQTIRPIADSYAARLDRKISTITLRDTSSRWGSCSPDGKLSFSWRLVMAPPAVVDYVIAHEVAHLVELNHSPRFWNTVAGLVGTNLEPRHWLKTNGLSLHRYGAEPRPVQ